MLRQTRPGGEDETSVREEPMAAENDVSRRSAEKSEGEPPGQVAQALVERTHALLDQRQYEELLSLSGEVIQRFGEAPEEAVRVQVARAYISKAIALGQLERFEECLSLCDEALRRL